MNDNGTPERPTPGQSPHEMTPERLSRIPRARRGNTRFTLWVAGGVIFLLILILIVGHGRFGSGKIDPECRFLGSISTLTPAQTGNAATITAVAVRRNLPDRAVTIALSTALQESRLQNLDHGDRDSVGVFQQRPSQGWGTSAQLQDPVYAAGRFYGALVEIPNWRQLPVTVAAQKVQRSAFPNAYARWEPQAAAAGAALLARSAQPAFACQYDHPVRPLGAAAAAQMIKRQLGVDATVSGATLTVSGTPRMESVATAWLVAYGQGYGASSVVHAGRIWKSTKIEWKATSEHPPDVVATYYS